MSKRASPDGDGDGMDCQSDEESACNSQDGQDNTTELRAPLKRRRIEFEPIRLLAVSGVNDIENKVERVQLYKLSERLRLKDRLLAEERRKNEALHMRQDRDDTILCTLNRCWNRLDEEMRMILNRHDASVGIKKEDPDEEEIDVSRDFLADLVEKEGEDADALCDKRVSSTLSMVQSVMDIMKRQADQHKQFSRSLENALAISAGEERKAVLCEVFESLQKAGEMARLSSANVRLTKEIDKYQQMNREVALKGTKLQDEMSLKNTRIEELMQQLEDKDFELRKAWAREEKLDYRLFSLAQERREGLLVTNKTNGVSRDCGGSREVSDLQAECELQRDLAASRLDEIEKMTSRIADLVADNETLKLQQQSLTVEAIRNSEEYQNLKVMFDAMYVMAEDRIKELEITRSLNEIAEAKHIEVMKEFEKESQQMLNRLRQQLAFQESEVNRIKSDYDMLRIEFEQNLTARSQQQPRQQDYKSLSRSLDTMARHSKKEAEKFKKKWKEAVNTLQQVQRKLEHEKRYREQCVMIRIDAEHDGELRSPDANGCKDHDENVEDEANPDTFAEMETFVSRLRTRIDEIKARLDAHQEVDNEKRDVYEIISKERRQRYENERLISVIKRLCSKDRKEKMKFYAEECALKITDLEEQNRALQMTIDTVKAEEEQMTQEMETTGSAYETMQEEYIKLQATLKEKDEQSIKMLNDQMVGRQIQHQLREEKSALEEQVSSLNNMVSAQSQEIKQLKQTHDETTQLLKDKDGVYRKVSLELQRIQQKQLESTLQVTDFSTRLDKVNAQLKEALEAVRAKSKAHESDANMIKRLEEEKSHLKKRLERAKKYEQHGGNKEVVLTEEIKEYKEITTCPSCKVNQKDGVLTKCFHVFCMKCLQTRYDTRRRKCPKCNAAFGANDFHRLYLS